MDVRKQSAERANVKLWGTHTSMQFRLGRYFLMATLNACQGTLPKVWQKDVKNRDRLFGH